MTRRGRCRWLKWAVTAVFLLTVAMAALSLVRFVKIQCVRLQVAMGAGVAFVRFDDSARRPVFDTDPIDYAGLGVYVGWATWTRMLAWPSDLPPGTGSGTIPMWMILAATGIPAYLLWRSDRRRPLGQCAKCGYDLTGNASGVCPECGQSTGSGPAAPS